jgi:hypothetical protein
MKNTLLLTALFVVFCTAVTKSQSLNGAYKILEAQYGEKPMTKEEIGKEIIIKIFKDGYWIGAFFGNPDKPFNGTCGGTYKLKDSKYVETVDFYSWDSTAVGKVYTFDYNLSGNQYKQTGYMESEKYNHFFINEKYQKIVATGPLKNNSLEGAWKMQTGEWGNTRLGEDEYEDVVAVKIYAFPRFAFAYYNDKTKAFVGAGGGTYQFDGKTLAENVEYWSWGKISNANPEFQVSFSGTGYMQASADKSLKESWRKLN